MRVHFLRSSMGGDKIETNVMFSVDLIKVLSVIIGIFVGSSLYLLNRIQEIENTNRQLIQMIREIEFKNNQLIEKIGEAQLQNSTLNNLILELLKKNEDLTLILNQKIGFHQTSIVHELIIPSLKSPIFWGTIIAGGTLFFFSYQLYLLYTDSFISKLYSIANEGGNQLLTKVGLYNAIETHVTFDLNTGNKYVVEIIKHGFFKKDTITMNIEFPDGSTENLITYINHLTKMLSQNTSEITGLLAQIPVKENSITLALNNTDNLLITGTEIANGANQLALLML